MQTSINNNIYRQVDKQSAYKHINQRTNHREINNTNLLYRPTLGANKNLRNISKNEPKLYDGFSYPSKMHNENESKISEVHDNSQTKTEYNLHNIKKIRSNEEKPCHNLQADQKKPRGLGLDKDKESQINLRNRFTQKAEYSKSKNVTNTMDQNCSAQSISDRGISCASNKQKGSIMPKNHLRNRQKSTIRERENDENDRVYTQNHNREEITSIDTNLSNNRHNIYQNHDTSNKILSRVNYHPANRENISSSNVNNSNINEKMLNQTNFEKNSKPKGSTMYKHFGSSHYKGVDENSRDFKATIFGSKMRERPNTNSGNTNINNSRFQTNYSNNRVVTNNFGVKNLTNNHIGLGNNASSEQSEYRAQDVEEIKKKYKKPYNSKTENNQSEDEVVEMQKSKNLNNSGISPENPNTQKSKIIDKQKATKKKEPTNFKDVGKETYYNPRNYNSTQIQSNHHVIEDQENNNKLLSDQNCPNITDNSELNIYNKEQTSVTNVETSNHTNQLNINIKPKEKSTSILVKQQDNQHESTNHNIILEINSTSQNQVQNRIKQLDNKIKTLDNLGNNNKTQDKKSSIQNNPNFLDNINNAKVNAPNVNRNSSTVVNTQNNPTFVGVLNPGNNNPTENNQIVKNPTYQNFITTTSNNLISQNANTHSSNSIIPNTNQVKKKIELNTKNFKPTKLTNNDLKNNLDVFKFNKITNKLLVEKSNQNEPEKSNEYQLNNPSNQIQKNDNYKSNSERSSTIPKNNPDISKSNIMEENSMEALTSNSVINAPQVESSEMPRPNNILEQKIKEQRALSTKNNGRLNVTANKKKREEKKSTNNIEKKYDREMRCVENVVKVNIKHVNFFFNKILG